MAEINGTENNDTLNGTNDDDSINGLGGDDSISSGRGNDTIFGGDGNDTIFAASGDDVIDPGAGDDEVRTGFGFDYVVAGAGNDTIIGEALLTRDLTVDYSNSTTGVTLTFDGADGTANGASHESGEDSLRHVQEVILTDLADTATLVNVFSSGAPNRADLGAGDDFLTTDRVGFYEGGDGDDTISLIRFDSTTFDMEAGTLGTSGGLATNFEHARLDDSRLANVLGTSGDNRIEMVDSDFATVQAGDGNDTIVFEGAFANLLDGGDGDDLITIIDGGAVIVGGAGNDTIQGGGFEGDQVDYSGTASALEIDLAAGTATSADGNDVMTEIDDVTGTAFDDTITGDDGNNDLFGGDGNDLITGAGGNDSMTGGAGNDTLDAGPGDDTVRAGDGEDLVTGGDGNDSLFGDADNDTLDAGSSDDRVVGGDGDDLITGGAGNDSLSGGAGNDIFVFSDGSGEDTISDFDMADDDGDGQTNDQLDVSGLTDSDG